MIQQRYVLGIEGGSKKTDAILVTMNGTLIAEEGGGPTDLSAINPERVAKVILDLAQRCCRKASCRSSDLHVVVVGLAGASREVDRSGFQNQLLQLSLTKNVPLSSVIVETDLRIALEAAFASGPGVILVVGTGSTACAKGEDGKIHQIGGWGRILGDEGGQYALSREALNAALRAHDGRGSRTLLLKYALDHFAVPSLDDLVIKINRGQVDGASFFPMLLRAEGEGDHVAHGILFRGAGEVADLVRVLTMRIQPKRKLPVSLLGELLDNENVYSKMVRDKIAHSLPQVVVQKPKFPPAFGAVILALKPFEFKK